MESKHILLISYTFPPYPGIGGRRWAKFAKYLSRQGYTIHVIHAKNPKKDAVSIWIDDIKNNPNIKRYELKSHYPNILTINPSSYIDKIKYKIALFSIQLLSKGTPYDKGIFWKNTLLKTSTELIKKYNIKNVITSCAPFSSAYFSIELKNIFPHIKLMIDFRDPWTWGSGYGYSILAQKKLSFEKKQESRVIEKSDSIFVPTEIMKQYLQKTYSNESKKIEVLPHGFDKDEISICSKNITSDKTKIIFYGSLYDGIEKYISILSKEFEKLKNELELHIYSESVRYSDNFEKHGLLNNNVFFHKPLPTIELFKKIQNASFVLLIHPDYGIHNISTKFYEIIYSKTPILYIGKKGLTYDFVTKNKIGYSFDESEIVTNFSKIIQKNYPYDYNSNYNIEEYSFEKLCHNLIVSHFII